MRLIIVIIVSLVIAYFAIQNTAGVTLTLANYPLADVPLYLIVLGSLLTGLVIGWFLQIIKIISSSFSLRGKEKNLQEAQKTITTLTKRVHELELENAKLSGEDEVDDTSL